jgi:predicted metal-dependent phosphotriesterase family hydrolase
VIAAFQSLSIPPVRALLCHVVVVCPLFVPVMPGEQVLPRADASFTRAVACAVCQRQLSIQLHSAALMHTPCRLAAFRSLYIPTVRTSLCHMSQ